MKLCLVSLTSRRDLDHPLEGFREVQTEHFYAKDLDQNGARGNYANVWDLIAKLKAAKPDLIQGVEPLTFPAGFGECLALLWLKWRYGMNYFFPMLENIAPKDKFGPLIGFFAEKLLRLYARNAQCVIALNDGAEQSLRKIGLPEDKLKRLMWGCWGIDPQEFCPKPDLPKQQKLLFVGGLEQRKGVYDLLPMFQKVRQKFPELRLQIIGDGPLRGWVENYVREHNLQNAVSIEGFVPNDQLPQYFQESLLTVSPTWTMKRWIEQVGMVNLQSISCAVPVVATQTGAIPEYLPEGQVALLVPEKSVDQFASAVIRLLDDQPLRENMAEKGRKHILEHYQEAQNIQKAEQFILEGWATPKEAHYA